jgi:hypothetical protein
MVKSLGLDTWYFVAVDYTLGESLVAEASDAIARSGGKVVGTVYHPISTTDLASFLLQAPGQIKEKWDYYTVKETDMKQLKSAPINDVFARNGHIRADGRMVHDLYLVQVRLSSRYPKPGAV